MFYRWLIYNLQEEEIVRLCQVREKEEANNIDPDNSLYVLSLYSTLLLYSAKMFSRRPLVVRDGANGRIQNDLTTTTSPIGRARTAAVGSLAEWRKHWPVICPVDLQQSVLCLRLPSRARVTGCDCQERSNGFKPEQVLQHTWPCGFVVLVGTHVFLTGLSSSVSKKKLH